MSALVAVFLATGWQPGTSFLGACVLTTQGAAFSAVILGQMANAFPRPAAHPLAGRFGLDNQPAAQSAVAAGLLRWTASCLSQPVASLLGHAPPPLWG